MIIIIVINVAINNQGLKRFNVVVVVEEAESSKKLHDLLV